MILIHCSRCGNDVKIPDFAHADKASLMELIQANKPLLTTKKIRDKTDFDLKDAKRLMVHLNSPKGPCHRCSF